MSPSLVRSLVDSHNGKLISLSSVLDLPQIHTKPSGTEILRALDLLAIKPRNFASASKVQEAAKVRGVHPAGITRYLTTIISSSLSWLETDELREAVWDATSARLSERCGRSGTRETFPCPFIALWLPTL